MSLDIAPASPPAPPGLVPGAKAALPTLSGLAFAALLAGSVPAKPGAATTGSDPPPEAAAKTPPRKGKKQDNELPEPQTPLLMIPLPVLPAPLPKEAAPQPNTSPKLEAMDTVPAPALSGAAQSGGELLPQTKQPDAAAPGRTVDTSAQAAAFSINAPQQALANVVSAPAQTGADAAKASAIAVVSAAQAPATAVVSAAQAPAAAVADPTKLSTAVLTDAAPRPAFGSAAARHNGLQNGGQPANNKSIGQTLMQRTAEIVAGNAAPTTALKPVSAAHPAFTEDAPVKPSAAPDAVAIPTPPVKPEPVTLSAAAPAPALSPADKAALVQQASDGIAAMRVQAAPNGQSQMTLQLHPQEWGRLQVSVVMTPTGTDGGTTVTAHLVAQNEAVKTALESQTSDLRRALHDAGMTLDKLSVTVQSVQAGSEAQSAGSDPRQQSSQGGQSGMDAWAQANLSSGTGAHAGQGGGRAFGEAQTSTVRPGVPEDDPQPMNTLPVARQAVTAQGVDLRA